MSDDWEDSDESVKPLLCIDAFIADPNCKLGVREKACYAKPKWEEVERYLDLVFVYAGRVALDYRVKGYDGEYVFDQVGPGGLKRLWVQENNGKYILSAFFEWRDPTAFAPKKHDPLGERRWWEPEGTPYRGEMRWYDHPYDARSFCSDVNVAKRIFKDVFDNGTLTEASLKEMRDGDYKPPT
jgi:hypothetical protein